MSVRHVLQSCSQEFGYAGDWYLKLSAQRAHTKEIRQVGVHYYLLCVVNIHNNEMIIISKYDVLGANYSVGASRQ